MTKKEGEFHLQLYASSPAPKRDYHGLTITDKYVILNSWDISRGPHVYPRKRRISLDHFSEDKSFCSEIRTLFGDHVLHYVHRVASEDASLYTLPQKVFRKVLGYLAVGDILRIGQSSKIFFQMCNSNDIWKLIFRKKLRRPPNKAEQDMSELMSWRHILYRQIYEKIQNQKISAKFKQSVEKLQKQNRKEADKIRQNNQTSFAEIFKRDPPEDKYKTKKIPFRTYKLQDLNENESYLVNKMEKIINPAKHKGGKSETNIKHSFEVKKMADSKPEKVRTQSANKMNKTVKENDKNVKLSKSGKELNNLKSKSVFM